MTAAPILLSTLSYGYLERELAVLTGWECAEIERHTFPDGEYYRRIGAPCRERDVVLVGGTISDRETLELYDLACGVVQQGAHRLTLVIPFFGYSTMERAVRDGEIVTAKVRARLLSSVPAAAMGNRVLLVDLHAAGIAHYFEGDMQPVHVYAKSVIKDVATRLGGDDFVLACTDAGRAKWVESLALDLGVTPAFVYKRRLDGARTEVSGVSAHVAGRSVVIYDDMIRTGSSLIGAATAYRDAGATSIAAVATHGLFPGDSLDQIARTGLFDHIVCTNSHPRAVELAGDVLSVESIAPVLAEQLEDGS